MISIVFELKNSKKIILDNFNAPSLSVAFRNQNRVYDEINISASSYGEVYLKDCWEQIRDIKDDVMYIEVKNDDTILYSYIQMEDVSYSLTFGEANSIVEMLSFSFKKN